MPTTTTPCWACSYSDSKDQTNCWVCSSSPSSSTSPRTRLLSPSTTNSRWTIPAISAAKLQKLWQRCGSENTKEWHEALDLIKTLNPTRLCTSPSEADTFPENQSPPTILLQDSDYFEKTPSVTLTSASSASAPTMNLVTWHTFGQSVWSTSDVHVTTMQNGTKKHNGKEHCRLCRSDVEVNGKWVEAMGMDRTTEAKEKAEMIGKDDYAEIERMMRSLSLEDCRPPRDVVMSDSWVEVNT